MKATSQAKRETYVKQIESGNLNTQTSRVLHYIRYNPLCDTDELRTKLEMPHQSLTAIVSNLLDIGVIAIVGEIGKRNQVYSVYRYIHEPHLQRMAEKERQEQKFKLWIKQGINMYGELMTESLIECLKTQEMVQHDDFKQGEFAF
jgi:hypothetical protein